jgi:DNA repair protein RadC
MGISDWPEDERPRERLQREGPAALSDAELLAIFLRVGVRGKSAVDLARGLIEQFGGSLPRLAAAPAAELQRLSGMGPAKAAQLAATLELARRALRQEMAQRDVLSSPQQVRDYLRLRLGGLAHEVFMALLLDAHNRLIEPAELFRGTLTQTGLPARDRQDGAGLQRRGGDLRPQPPLRRGRAEPRRRAADPAAQAGAGACGRTRARPFHRRRERSAAFLRRARAALTRAARTIATAA